MSKREKGAGTVGQALVIVESPAKARTIAGFLGDGFVVESSIGHIRDLPRKAGDVPEKYKKEAWSRLGVDTENDFRPLYIVDPGKKEHIKKLKALLKDSSELLLATDEDREGESIAWHLLEVLNPKVPVKRMVFHEITKRAIRAALDSPRELDRSLVDAQEARRILDRLYGYEVSPVLWKKVMPKLSAGRVQSVATRIIVERERERMAFRAAQYWDVTAELSAMDRSLGSEKPTSFDARLLEVAGDRVAQGKDFDSQGKLKSGGSTSIRVLDGHGTRALCEGLQGAAFTVTSVERKPTKRSPAAPFMTSSLQQEAGRKLRFSASRTMRGAQRLYENGYITYMRTDSTTLSESALTAARSLVKEKYGADYLPAAPRQYKKKVKNAQEAHEAIRPAGDVFRLPEDVAREVEHDEAVLYELIWKRTVASQMVDARGHSVRVRIGATTADGTAVKFGASGNTIAFPGFLRAYVEGSDDPDAELDSKERPLPALQEGQGVDAKKFVPESHETQPPARYTEASLVRRLEELGVGRPSTYASILTTIQDRGYVWKRATALVPSFKAFAVVGLLERYFGGLVDYAFTARMEDDLDSIASGERETVPWLKRFYFGKQGTSIPANSNAVAEDLGLKALVNDQLGEIDAREVNTIHLGADENGESVVARVGRYGPYVQRGEDTASIPDDLPPDELSVEKALEFLSAPSGDRVLGKDPESGLDVNLKNGRFGSYVQLGEPEEGSKQKPKTASLLKSMDPATLTLEEALKLLTLPREVGKDPESGEVITAQNGRYGPYLTRGKDNRSLENEDQLFTVTVEQALALFAQPKTSRGRKAAEPLKELGKDPVSGETITLRKGRFGFYVTDGETNASLRTADDPDTILPERAQELLQIRRDRGPSTKKTKKRPAKKAAKKTTKKAAKKATKKTTKKAAAKKTAAKTASGAS